jgi:pyruvate/2-oxoglutarate dehydrogenase complex dihydrolipoamide dehydrogenase (E3) component
MQTIEADICVIGAGSAGLSVAAGAAQLGAKTVLFEKGKMGGDCLNYGCVPSKSLLAAGKAAKVGEQAARMGVHFEPPRVDFNGVGRHVHGVIAAIAPNDSVERFEGLGVKVVQQAARFTGEREVSADGVRVRARRVVVATGSSASTPPIPGIDEVPYLTNESVFDNPDLPEHLIVIGGGPIGLEMAQAHRMLGSRVTVLEVAKVLAKDDAEAAEVLKKRLASDGIVIREGIKILRAERDGNGIAIVLEGEERVVGSHLLVAAGRKPNVTGLDLEKAGIEYSPKGIKVDARLRTTNSKVFAIGDCAGGPQFTHVAGYHAGIVIRNALFRLPAKVDYAALPWVTFTEPELAQAGLTEAQAKEQHGADVTALRWPFHENDRAQAERETDGFVKVMATRKGRVLGATIVGPHAGELIHVWGLMIQQKMSVKALASMIAPYPTLGEANKRAAGSFFTPQLFSERTRKVVRMLSWFG